MSCTIYTEYIKERGAVMKPLALATLAALSLGLLGGCDQAPERSTQPDLLTSFDKADANKDGVIERSEATSIANRDFADVDTDHNESVSLEEFQVALRNAAPPRG
jgi:EF hand domain-containing protein